jgi:hypothetical protein
MTDLAHARWRQRFFRNASLIAGFGVKAPSRYREASADFIRDTLRKADELDSRMRGKDAILDPKFVTQAFRALDSVANTQSVIDYCHEIVEGQPGNNRLSCEQQWATLIARAKVIKAEYLSLSSPSMDPPAEDGLNELREFYNLLQSTCPARESSRVPREEKENAERMRTALRETVIRLIFWWNVQKNFSTYFAHDLAELRKILPELGIREPLPALDGTTGRVDFVRKYHALKKEIENAEKRARNGRERQLVEEAKKRFRFYFPLLALEGEDSVGDAERSDEARTLRNGGIPFHWIEPGAELESRRLK